MNKQKRTAIFSILRKLNPNPKTELNYSSTFELLIAVILSAQATDISVNKATDKLYTIANTPKQIFKLGVDGLIPYIKSIGLYKSKARNIIKTCEDLINKFNSQVPDNLGDLINLAGAGRKTAYVILKTAVRQVAIAVDTHIFRLSNRIPIAKGKDVVEVEKRLLKLVPTEFLIDAHHWLILHGRYICVARNPKCNICPIFHLCEYKEKFKFKDYR